MRDLAYAAAALAAAALLLHGAARKATGNS
jgi:hypothetical protein